MHADSTPQSYGLLAEFSSDRVMMHAAMKIRDAGFKRTDAYTPFPVHGVQHALGHRQTRMNLVMLLAGITGFAIGIWLQWWVSARTYPHIVAGKPYFSWPSFIPIIFECTVLVCAVTGFITLWTRNGLPRVHHPLFAVKEFERHSTDKFFIVIKADDKLYDAARVRALLLENHAENVYEVPMDGATHID